MNHVTKTSWFGLFVLLLTSVCPTIAWTQEPLEFFDPEEEFEKAEAFMDSFKNDSANIILTKLMVGLAASKELETPFGLKVQLRQAEALEKDHQDEEAIQKLLKLVEVATQKEAWDIFANAHLSLARLHEKLGREDSCLMHLKEVKSAIAKYNLDKIYPRYAIRTSSYHRQFNDLDSALFYANEVLRTAPENGLFNEKAVGHLLVGLLLSNTSYQEGVEHLKQAGATWKQVEDYSGYSATLSNISRLHLQNNNTQLALSYNDTSLAVAEMAAAAGNDERWMFYTNYQDRAAIYKALGQQDSAWLYLNKGFQIELEDMQQLNSAKIVEIDAKYKDEKKAQKISEQELVIAYQKERRNYTLGIGAIILLLASMVTVSYFRLRKANRKTEEQGKIIRQTNEDLAQSLQQQILLQGEIHHRVKNNLQVIISLLEIQIDDIVDPQARINLEAMSNRIYSMAAIHEMLYQKEGNEMINLLEYTQNLCQHFSNFSQEENKPVFQLNFKDQYFNLATLMPLGIILSELLTNSIKYASSSLEKRLTIGIGLKKTEEGFCILYRDNGPGFPEGNLVERDGGLGTYLLKSMSRQLNGYLESNNDGGAVCNIFFKEKTQGLTHG